VEINAAAAAAAGAAAAGVLACLMDEYGIDVGGGVVWAE
jgi:hypothetical protein